jgi:hypothetical protein
MLLTVELFTKQGGGQIVAWRAPQLHRVLSEAPSRMPPKYSAVQILNVRPLFKMPVSLACKNFFQDRPVQNSMHVWTHVAALTLLNKHLHGYRGNS